MTEREIELLEGLVASFAGDGERFAITNKSLRVLAEEIGRRLRTGNTVEGLEALQQMARGAGLGAYAAGIRERRGAGGLPILRDSDARAMFLACPKNHPGI